MHIPSFTAIPAACLMLLAAVPPAAAEDGVSADKIVFGQAAALGGPAGALGQGMKIGIEAAFAEVNKAGGVKGRKLELKSVDDGYEPTKSIEVVKKLLADDKVFADRGPGRHADRDGDAADRERGRRALHRCVHRQRGAARPVQAVGR